MEEDSIENVSDTVPQNNMRRNAGRSWNFLSSFPFRINVIMPTAAMAIPKSSENVNDRSRMETVKYWDE